RQDHDRPEDRLPDHRPGQHPPRGQPEELRADEVARSRTGRQNEHAPSATSDWTSCPSVDDPTWTVSGNPCGGAANVQVVPAAVPARVQWAELVSAQTTRWQLRQCSRSGRALLQRERCSVGGTREISDHEAGDEANQKEAETRVLVVELEHLVRADRRK